MAAFRRSKLQAEEVGGGDRPAISMDAGDTERSGRKRRRASGTKRKAIFALIIHLVVKIDGV